jgi:hypothetical protein
VDPTEILALFDEQMRRKAAPDCLVVGKGWSGVIWPPDDGEVEPLVARMRELPGHVEWKYYSHDGPELRERLLAVGLEPDDEETVVVAEIDRARMHEIRTKLPSLANRRVDAYRWPAPV